VVKTPQQQEPCKVEVDVPVDVMSDVKVFAPNMTEPLAAVEDNTTEVENTEYKSID